MPIPIRLRLDENATLMLHLYLLEKGCCQQCVGHWTPLSRREHESVGSPTHMPH